MWWPTIALGLVGLAGLLYGLLERSKRQAAEGKAGILSRDLNKALEDHRTTVSSYEASLAVLRQRIETLSKNVSNLPLPLLVEHLNELLTWRVREANPGASPSDPAVPSKSPSADGGTDPSDDPGE